VAARGVNAASSASGPAVVSGTRSAVGPDAWPSAPRGRSAVGPGASPAASGGTSSRPGLTGSPTTATATPLPERSWGVFRRRDGTHESQPASVAVDADTPMLDGLTGLGDHRAYRDELERQAASYARHRVPFALLLVDVDGLRFVNDEGGHHAGDELLRSVAEGISLVGRFADRAFRMGGDEFAVLLPHTDEAGAIEMAKRLRARLQATANGGPVASFSAGIASCPAQAVTGRDIATQAELALGRSKRRGRGGVEVFDPLQDVEHSDADAAVEAAAVATVVRERQLRAVFQPIVDLATGAVLGYEGLVRPTEAAPFANPSALFKAAEAAGRTVELDAACFDVVTRAATVTDPRTVVSLNLSPRTIETAEFDAAAMVASLVQLGFHPGRLIIELTEREAVQDMPRLRHNLAELQRAGIRIAADDVGAGNAGLRLLAQFRFDIVKIDLSLVQDGAERDSSHEVLRSLRDLAGRQGAFVIAEGIETASQLRVVRELGLSAGQGYLLGRPSPSIDLPPIDLLALEQGEQILQNAPVPVPDHPEMAGRSA